MQVIKRLLMRRCVVSMELLMRGIGALRLKYRRQRACPERPEEERRNFKTCFRVLLKTSCCARVGKRLSPAPEPSSEFTTVSQEIVCFIVSSPNILQSRSSK